MDVTVMDGRAERSMVGMLVLAFCLASGTVAAQQDRTEQATDQSSRIFRMRPPPPGRSPIAATAFAAESASAASRRRRRIAAAYPGIRSASNRARTNATPGVAPPRRSR